MKAKATLDVSMTLDKRSRATTNTYECVLTKRSASSRSVSLPLAIYQIGLWTRLLPSGRESTSRRQSTPWWCFSSVVRRKSSSKESPQIDFTENEIPSPTGIRPSYTIPQQQTAQSATSPIEQTQQPMLKRAPSLRRRCTSCFVVDGSTVSSSSDLSFSSTPSVPYKTIPILTIDTSGRAISPTKTKWSLPYSKHHQAQRQMQQPATQKASPLVTPTLPQSHRSEGKTVRPS